MKFNMMTGLIACMLANFANAADLPRTGNTPTGEDRSVILDREAAALDKEIRENKVDKQRWARTNIYASSTKAEDLSMTLIADKNFTLSLRPKEGNIEFLLGNRKDVFEVGVPYGTKNNVCPNYNIRTLFATSDYVLFRKVCPGYEYGFNGKLDKYHYEVNYFLYDAKTATTAVLWKNWTSDKATPGPDPETKPSIKKISNGYELDWRAIDPVKNEKFYVHTKYTMEKIDGKLQLVCSDLNAPKEERHSGYCEYGQIPAIKK